MSSDKELTPMLQQMAPKLVRGINSSLRFRLNQTWTSQQKSNPKNLSHSTPFKNREVKTTKVRTNYFWTPNFSPPKTSTTTNPTKITSTKETQLVARNSCIAKKLTMPAATLMAQKIDSLREKRKTSAVKYS
jgi:hypothetical protein